MTGLDKLEDVVGLPDFSGTYSQDYYPAGNPASHFQEYFASQIVLRRLSMEFHSVLMSGKPHSSAFISRFTLAGLVEDSFLSL